MTQELGRPAPPLARAHLAREGEAARQAWVCACALPSWPPPRVPVTGTAGRSRFHVRPDGGAGSVCGRGKASACAGISGARTGSARARPLAPRRRSPRRWAGQGRACGGHVAAGRGGPRGAAAAGVGRGRGVFERRGRGRAQQLLPEHFLTQQSGCAGRASPRRL